ncbi:glycosyltransferase family 9 protein [Pelagibius litoralis]|uniref:Glycosyltransferase family 9 protein n=2 Tax=Pelagibius litoralis TaxID=374515 RepID=A0A967F0G4_9PROT|nr:glycosyltransferase family 9 protein [Pelagibius litoralis]
MRLLFITATRIGDAVLSTGLLDHLLAERPGIRVTVAVGRLSAPLFAAVPGLERIIAVDKQSHNRHWLKLLGKVALTRWDTVVDLRGSATAYVLWAGRRLVIGKRRPGRHRVEELGDLLDLSPPPAPTVWLSEAARQRAAALLPEGVPILAMAPAANWMGKQWPAERFGELAQRLTGPEGMLPGARIAVFAAPHEREQAAPVLAAAGARGVDLINCGDLLDVAACLQRAAFFCGNDSGLMHLAAAAGVPTLGLFGPSPDARYRPWGGKAGFVRTPESFQELTGDGFDFAAKACFMESLTVNAAERAAQELWAKASGA